MKDKSNITILIASYNRLELLRKCIESVLSQKNDFIDILIVDDGSDTQTRQWLASLDDSVRVIYQNNQGVAKARYTGVLESKSEYILILDSDDLLIEGAVEYLMVLTNKLPDIDLFYCNNIEKRVSGKHKKSAYKSFDSNAQFIHALFLFPKVPYKHSGTLFKKNVAISLGNYDLELRSKIDIDFLLKFLIGNKRVFFIEKPLIEFYFHFESISRKSRLSGIISWYKLINKNFEKRPLIRAFYLYTRSIWEISKFLYEQVMILKSRLFS